MRENAVVLAKKSAARGPNIPLAQRCWGNALLINVRSCAPTHIHAPLNEMPAFRIESHGQSKSMNFLSDCRNKAAKARLPDCIFSDFSNNHRNLVVHI